MSDIGWEQRMAARAKVRGEDWDSAERRGWAAHWAALVSKERALQAQMTLGRATALLRHQEPFGCACTGFPDCCMYRYPQAQSLQRAAHITVKLFADRIEKMARTTA